VRAFVHACARAQVSDSLLALLLADTRGVLKITSTGLKLFERQDSKGRLATACPYRIAQVGFAAGWVAWDLHGRYGAVCIVPCPVQLHSP
jgi:hypothetical protein